MKIKPILLGAALVMAGCATVSNQVDRIVKFIEGEDRIEMVGSSAEVSALVAADEALTPILPSNESPLSQPEPSSVATVQATKSNATPPVIKPVSPPAITQPEKPAKPNPVAEIPSKVSQPKTPVTNKPSSKEDSAPAERLAKPLNSTVKSKGVVLSGRVQLTGLGGEQIIDDQSILTLIPKQLALKTEMNNGERSRQHVIDMKDKAYAPDYLVVNVEDTVVFTNSDKIKHNVFSPSGENAFDLGTYSAGKKRGVTFNKPGVVKVYCNIHPKMATFVSVTEKGLSAVSDIKGAFTFKNVPPGDYTLSAWNIRGETVMDVTVAKRAINNFIVNIEAQKKEVEKHENKFGEAYKPRSALFDDEFY